MFLLWEILPPELISFLRDITYLILNIMISVRQAVMVIWLLAEMTMLFLLSVMP
ncbi:hypothetical protein EC2860050_3419 [Escherichia coli 2860050]|nr:hypothetical protein EC2860050_3419 [Escherichia coli 2860050]